MLKQTRLAKALEYRHFTLVSVPADVEFALNKTNSYHRKF